MSLSFMIKWISHKVLLKPFRLHQRSIEDNFRSVVSVNVPLHPDSNNNCIWARSCWMIWGTKYLFRNGKTQIIDVPLKNINVLKNIYQHKVNIKGKGESILVKLNGEHDQWRHRTLFIDLTLLTLWSKILDVHCSTRLQMALEVYFSSEVPVCYYRPQRSCGNVIFLHLSVSHSVHREEVSATPPRQTPPGQTTPSLCSACWDMVNKRTVRILLECILVYNKFSFNTFRLNVT